MDVEALQQEQKKLQREMETIGELSKTLVEIRANIEMRGKDIQARVEALAREEAELHRRKVELQKEVQSFSLERQACVHNLFALEKKRRTVMDALAKLGANTPEIPQAEAFAAQPVVPATAPSIVPPDAPTVVPINAPPVVAAAPPVDRPGGQRTQERIAVAVEVNLMSENNFYLGLTENLSEGGLFLATYDTLPIGTQVDLAIHIPNTPPIPVEGRVQWIRMQDILSKTESDMVPGMGIQFTSFSEESKSAIQKFLQVRDPLFFDND